MWRGMRCGRRVSACTRATSLRREEGWTRYVLDKYGFEYESLLDGEAREGGLGERFDAIVLPHQQVWHINRGHRESYYAPQYSGGLGEKGAGEPARVRRTGRNACDLGRVGAVRDTVSRPAGAECAGRT